MSGTANMMVLVGLAAAAPSTEAGEPPAEVVRGLIDTLRRFETDGTAIPQAERRSIVQAAHARLDFEKLAREALRDTWTGLPPEKRSAFVNLLEQVFAEVAYPQSAKFFGTLKLEFGEVRGRGEQRVVPVAVSHPDEGLVDLEFFVGRSGGRWKVQDLSLDGISLGRDIRSQMYAIVSKDGYGELVRRMKDKLEEKDS